MSVRVSLAQATPLQVEGAPEAAQAPCAVRGMSPWEIFSTVAPSPLTRAGKQQEAGVDSANCTT